MDREAIKQIVRQAVQQTLAAKSTAPPAADEPASSAYFAPWTGVTYPAEPHPSQDQFNINEATSTRGELLEFVAAQGCTIEKNKPCDHCGMCRTLGF